MVRERTEAKTGQWSRNSAWPIGLPEADPFSFSWPGELKLPGQSRQGCFQGSRIDLVSRHHGQGHWIAQKIGQRQLAVIHRGALRDRGGNRLAQVLH
jgi:hypothetical protein